MPQCDPLDFECPKCGSKPGRRCTNYRNQGCAPHSGRAPRNNPPSSRPAPAAPRPKPAPSPSLFDLGDDQGDE
jgi:hypothetical protein